ncbi:MAG: HAD family hydrolase [Nitrospinae bacterium]|nr:HAD family hydrolase [Nitrospinota bacterium]
MQGFPIDPKRCLYITDLDGTLLRPDSSLCDEGIERLNRLIDDGLLFTVATARNYDSAYPILRNLRLNIPVILFNGVYLTEFHTGKNLLSTNYLARDLVDELLSLILSRGFDPFIYAYGDKHQVYYRAIANAGARNYLNSLNGDGRLRPSADYRIDDSESVSGMLLIDEPAVLEPLYRELAGKYPSDLNMYFAEDIAMPGYYWLQIFHYGANKGSMVRTLAERLGIPLSQVVVFGDYLNDLEMFKIAGRAVAVANALPEVKEAAHEVIGGNHAYAVIEYLESRALEK